jgi:hypothetical protein
LADDSLQVRGRLTQALSGRSNLVLLLTWPPTRLAEQ